MVCFACLLCSDRSAMPHPVVSWAIRTSSSPSCAQSPTMSIRPQPWQTSSSTFAGTGWEQSQLMMTMAGQGLKNFGKRRRKEISALILASSSPSTQTKRRSSRWWRSSRTPQQEWLLFFPAAQIWSLSSKRLSGETSLARSGWQARLGPALP